MMQHEATIEARPVMSKVDQLQAQLHETTLELNDYVRRTRAAALENARLERVIVGLKSIIRVYEERDQAELDARDAAAPESERVFWDDLTPAQKQEEYPGW